MGGEKKPYTTPQLTVYGKVDELTQQGGGAFVDVPQGTPVNGNINNVIGPS
jgi:hypothetical protein